MVTNRGRNIKQHNGPTGRKAYQARSARAAYRFRIMSRTAWAKAYFFGDNHLLLDECYAAYKARKMVEAKALDLDAYDG